MSDKLIIRPDKKYVKHYVAVFYHEESGTYLDLPLESKTEPKVIKEAKEVEENYSHHGKLIQIDRITRLRVYTSTYGQGRHIEEMRDILGIRKKNR